MATRTTLFGADQDGERLREHRVEVLEQLNRLIASPLFRNSRHYPKLLRYVVEQTLEGRGTNLKERALGIEVFGREPGYDTNLDPVVRTSACEVRKRIAQYYHEPGHESELRIDLPTGTYIPEFHLQVAEPPRPVPVPVALPAEAHPHQPWTGSRFVAAAVSVGLVAALTALLGANRPVTRSGVDQFWTPVWTGADTVLVCVGGRHGHDAQTANENPDLLHFAEALTMGRLFSVVRTHGRAYDARLVSAVTLPDLRRGPAILVSAYDNPWTMRMLRDLRFTFDREDGAALIRDHQHPAEAAWRVDRSVPEDQLSRDFALVSRVTDPLTEKAVVTIAGLTRFGTIAAGEFVSEERYLHQLADHSPEGWEHKNLQVVLQTELVGGVAGPPHVLAEYVW